MSRSSCCAPHGSRRVLWTLLTMRVFSLRLDSRVLGRALGDRRPVEIAVAIGERGQKTVAHDRRERQRDFEFFGGLLQQAIVFLAERQLESRRRKSLLHDDAAIDLVDRRGKQRFSQQLEHFGRLDAALGGQGENLGEAFYDACNQKIAAEFY